ncbi:hypothetical protein QYM36_002165, partial [Artemia franciscana]
CSGTTPVLRLDWSPEGQTLISAHAINGGGPTAQIIDRDGWKLQRDLVGHRKAVTCVRFSSCLYQKKSNVNNGKRIIGNTCAIGSKDLCISVWQNFLKRPLVVLRDLFTEPVLDLSWDYTGRRLLACSWDGTVAFMEFDKKEVGETLSATEKNSFFKRVYGSSYASDQPVRVIRENPLVPSIPMVVENDATPLQSADQSKLAPEPINEVQLVTPTSSQPLMPIGKQVESRMADGRRRITPMFIPPPSSLSLDATHATTITSDQITFTSSAQPSSQIVVERLEEGVDDDFEKQKSEKKTSAPLPEHFDVIKRPRMTAVQSTPKKSQGALSVNFQGAGGGRIKLPILEAKRMYSSSVEQNGILLNIEANNEAMTSGRDSLHKLICSRGSTKSWEQVFSSRILALECNNQVICVGTEDGSFHMFSVEGCRKFPPIVTSGISSLQVLRHFVFLLTSNGRVNVWNMSTSISTCRNVSVEDILKGSSVEIVNCSLTVNGMPVISLRDGNTYAYSQPIESWVLLAALEDPVTKSCDVQIPAFSAKEKKEYSLSSTFSSSLRPRSTVRCSTEVQTACTQSYLEHQVCASLAIESPGEYRAWLLALVKHLTTTAMEHRLRSICRDLLGPMYKSPAWSPEILSYVCAMPFKYDKEVLIGLFSPELTVAPAFFAKLVTLNLLGRTPNDRPLPQELLSNRKKRKRCRKRGGKRGQLMIPVIVSLRSTSLAPKTSPHQRILVKIDCSTNANMPSLIPFNQAPFIYRMESDDTGNRNGFFKDFHAKILKNITEEEINFVSKAETRIEKVKRVRYSNYFENLKFDLSLKGKSKEESERFRNDGNKLFQRKEYEKAAKAYTVSVLMAPNYSEDLEDTALALALANRSAAFYHLRKYKIAITDICEALEKGYPKELQVKVIERRGRCYLETGEKVKARADLESVLAALEGTKDHKLKSTANEIKNLLGKVDTLKNGSNKRNESNLPALPKGRNSLYESASKSVNIEVSSGEGRYAIASKEISIGEILVVEKPYASVLQPNKYSSHCHNCFKPLEAPIPCQRCSRISFCSSTCRNIAVSSYHKTECSLIDALWFSGISITCYLALRMVSQFPAIYFQKDPTKDRYSIESLVTHSDKRTAKDYFNQSLMAAFLLRCLSEAGYFLEINDDNCIDEVGGILLHYIEIVQFNTHEVSETIMDGSLDAKFMKTVFLGAAVYPTLALFNHSCEPGLVRYHVNDAVVARAMKRIRKGEAISENYGPIFSQMKTYERKLTLKEQYWFDCQCQPCSNNWPVFDDLDNQEWKFRCNSCNNGTKIPFDSVDAVIKCSTCLSPVNILKGLKKLQDTDDLFKTGTDLLEKVSSLWKIFMEVYLPFNFVCHNFKTFSRPETIIKRSCITSDGT